MWFQMKEKLSPQYVGPYEILKWIKSVAYELKLHSELVMVHLIFHVSMLKKCIGDPVSIQTLEGLGGGVEPLLLTGPVRELRLTS